MGEFRHPVDAIQRIGTAVLSFGLKRASEWQLLAKRPDIALDRFCEDGEVADEINGRTIFSRVPLAEWGHAARVALVKTCRTDAKALSIIREASGPPSSIRSLVK